MAAMAAMATSAAATAPTTATTDEVLAALDVLFVQASPPADARQRAGAWLETFQKTAAAWATADALIRRPDLPIAARVFAAQTFRQKIEYDLDQLDPQSTASLRDSLVQLLYEHRAGPKNMRTQLCLALADLAIQMLSWSDPVLQMIGMFAADREMTLALLQFLTVLPEEMSSNSKIHLERSFLVARTEQLLRGNAARVLDFLVSLLDSNRGNTDITYQVIDCLSSWIRSGDISAAMVCSTPAIDVAFQALTSPELFDVAVDVICDIVAHAGRQPHDMALIEGLCTRLLPLMTILQQSSEDPDVVRGICRIFLEAGEGFVGLIAASPNVTAFQTIVEGLLFCTSFPELEIAKISFSFWHLLTDTLCGTASSSSAATANRPFFAPVYNRLIDILLVHLRYPENLNGWTAQDRDEFRDFRHIMGDVLKDCVRILGDENALAKPFSILRTFFVAAGGANGPGDAAGVTNGSALAANAKWQEIEAPLFALRAMCREVSVGESRYMPEIMAMLPHLPSHPKVKYATILVIGRYAEWTNVHPEMLSYQLDYVSKGFEEDENTIAAASQTFRDLCKYCSQHLVRLLPQLHPFYTRTLNAVHHDDRRQLTEAVAHVIAAVPLSEIAMSLQLFVLPIAQNLHSFAAIPVESGDPDHVQHRTAVNAIDELKTIFRYAVPDGFPMPTEGSSAPVSQQQSMHPCVQVLAQMWPIFESLYTRHGSDSTIAEALARLFRHSLGSYRLHIAPLLRSLADILVSQYDRTGFSCHLWVAGHCARVFGDDVREEGAIVLALVERMIQITFRILKDAMGTPASDGHGGPESRIDGNGLVGSGSLNQHMGLVEIDDVVEDYHAMLSEVLDTSPGRFVASSALISATFDCAMFCLASSPSPRSLATVLRFLRDVLALALATRSPLPPAANALVCDLAAAQAVPLAHALMGGLVFTFPRDRDVVTDVAETILVLADVLALRMRTTNEAIATNTQDPNSHQQLLLSALASAVDSRFPSSELPPELRDAFLRRLSQACSESSRTRIASVLQDFAASYLRRNVLASRR